MVYRRIGVGAGKGEESGFRYIGVQPPLDGNQASRILKIVSMPEWLRWSLDYEADIIVGDNPSYTEYNADVSKALKEQKCQAVDRGVMKLARSIGQVLARGGDTFILLEPIIPTDAANPIFGASADQKRAELRIHMDSHDEIHER